MTDNSGMTTSARMQKMVAGDFDKKGSKTNIYIMY